MKHDLKVTLILIAIFLVTQFVGLGLLQANMKPVLNAATGEVESVAYADSGYVKALQMETATVASTVIGIILGILIGTALVLLLVKFKKPAVWKYLFTSVIIIGLTKAFGVFMNRWVALGTAAVLAIWKTFRPNMIVHNLTEIFVYGGVAIIIVQLMNIYIAALLLIIISVYDMIAVWKSKHMIKLAKFQIENKAFAGLSIPYRLKAAPEEKPAAKRPAAALEKKGEVRNAILGGGDMAFPLFFAGVLLETYGFLDTIIIPICAATALFLLFVFAKKDKFYPAMPFITAGCFAGWAIILLSNLAA